MKNLDLDNLELDPIASLMANSDKELVVITGFICSTDKSSISISEDRTAETYTIYPRSAIVSAFSPEKKGCGNDEDLSKTILVVYADARTKVVSNSTPATSSQVQALRMRNNGSGCGTACQSGDGLQKCCCGVGEKCISNNYACECRSAYGVGSSRPTVDGTMFPSFRASNSNGQIDSYLNNDMAMQAKNGIPGGPSTVPAGYYRECHLSPSTICDGNGCRTSYGWVCYLYPLPRQL